MTTTQFVWERFSCYFRGIDRVLADIARKERIERRLAGMQNSCASDERDKSGQPFRAVK